MKLILSLLVCLTSLMAYPEIFKRIGNDIFSTSDNCKLITIKNIELISKACESYILKSDTLLKHGESIDKDIQSFSAQDKKEYLKSLRSLKNEQEHIVRLMNKYITDNLLKDNTNIQANIIWMFSLKNYYPSENVFEAIIKQKIILDDIGRQKIKDYKYKKALELAAQQNQNASTDNLDNIYSEAIHNNVINKGKWHTFTYREANTKEHISLTSMLKVNRSEYKKVANHIKVVVYFQAKNTAKHPVSFGWLNKYIRDKNGFGFTPLVGEYSLDVQPYAISDNMYAEYKLPSYVDVSKLRWGLYDSISHSFRYTIKLYPKEIK